jgi:site-specific DNA recombinase
MATKPRNRNKAKQAALPTAAARVGLYLRVSTELQAEEGNGIDAQRAAMISRCKKEEWTDIHEYVDAGASGKSTEGRHEFQRLMADAKAGAIQIVMAAKLDRIARNTVDFLQTADELTKAGCRLVMLEPDIDLGTDTGRVMATMFAAFAEWERKLIAQRVMSGKAEQAKVGEFNGSPIPYGYTADWKIIVDESVIIRRIFAEFLAGKTFAAIADGLNSEGISTRRGARWQHPQVKHIIRNGVYAGLRQWNGQTMPAAGNSVPAIVSMDAWIMAEARQTRRGRLPQTACGGLTSVVES